MSQRPPGCVPTCDKKIADVCNMSGCSKTLHTLIMHWIDIFHEYTHIYWSVEYVLERSYDN